MRSKIVISSLFFTLLTTVCAALAESDLQIEEIVVTAQKREQSIQDVPVSVTAISADTIDSLGLQTTSDIARLSSSLTVIESNNKTNSALSIRGIGTNLFGIGIEQGVAVVVDDDVELRSRSLRGELAGVRPHGLDTGGRELVEVRERGLLHLLVILGADGVEGHRVALRCEGLREPKADVGVTTTVCVDNENLLGGGRGGGDRGHRALREEAG